MKIAYRPVRACKLLCLLQRRIYRAANTKFAHIRSYMSPGTMVPQKQGAYEKEAMGKVRLKMLTLPWCKQRSCRLKASKLLRLMQRRIRRQIQISSHSELHVTRYYVCTKARCISKGSYGEGKPKNVNLALVQTAHQPLRASKLLRLLQRRIGRPIQICANSELHIARYYGCTKASYI